VTDLEESFANTSLDVDSAKTIQQNVDQKTQDLASQMAITHSPMGHHQG
jgi:hypothetical protein